MQILFSESEESPGEEGLNILPGKVTLLKAEAVFPFALFKRLPPARNFLYII